MRLPISAAVLEPSEVSPTTALLCGSRIVVAYVDVNDGALDDGGDVADIGQEMLGAADPHLRKYTA
jgi:hypothetical protein